MFSVRLLTADYYASAPIPGLDAGYSEFRGLPVKQVPVIRVFGASNTGQKTCLHIHGVFPYIYVPFNGLGDHDKVMYQLASGIDKALNISLGNTNSTTQHIYNICLVSGIPFYGYHAKEHQFFKIYFYNPSKVKKATELLQNGAILNQTFQPHEAHIPYIQQFLIDYNLYGMNFVNLSHVKFRRDPNNPGVLENIPEELFLPERVCKISTCELEVDALAADIINRREITDQLGVNPGLKGIWDDEKQRRREELRSSQITLQTSQPRPNIQSTSSELFHKQQLQNKLLKLNSQIQETPSPSTNVPDTEISLSYPAEVPVGSSLLNASFLQVHVPSLNSSVNSETKETVLSSLNADDSIVNEELVLSLLVSSQQTTVPCSSEPVILDSQDLKVVNMLQELVEDESILGSQRPRTDGNCSEEDEDENEGIHDLSLTLMDSETDPHDQQSSTRPPPDDNSDGDSGNSDVIWENSFWLGVDEDIPQLDGATDLPDQPVQKKTKKSITRHVLEKTAGTTKDASVSANSRVVETNEDSCSSIEILQVVPVVSKRSVMNNVEFLSLERSQSPALSTCSSMGNVVVINQLEVLESNKEASESELTCDDVGDAVNLQAELFTDNFSSFTLNDESDPVFTLVPNSSSYNSLATTVSEDNGVDDCRSEVEFNIHPKNSNNFFEGVLIGDPSFTAQPNLSEKDELLENQMYTVPELWTNDNTTNGWLSNEKGLTDGSKLSDIDHGLLSEYEEHDLVEILEKGFNQETTEQSFQSSPSTSLCGRKTLVKTHTKVKMIESELKIKPQQSLQKSSSKATPRTRNRRSPRGLKCKVNVQSPLVMHEGEICPISVYQNEVQEVNAELQQETNNNKKSNTKKEVVHQRKNEEENNVDQNNFFMNVLIKADGELKNSANELTGAGSVAYVNQKRTRRKLSQGRCRQRCRMRTGKTQKLASVRRNPEVKGTVEVIDTMKSRRCLSDNQTVMKSTSREDGNAPSCGHSNQKPSVLGKKIEDDALIINNSDQNIFVVSDKDSGDSFPIKLSRRTKQRKRASLSTTHMKPKATSKTHVEVQKCVSKKCSKQTVYDDKHARIQSACSSVESFECELSQTSSELVLAGLKENAATSKSKCKQQRVCSFDVRKHKNSNASEDNPILKKGINQNVKELLKQKIHSNKKMQSKGSVLCSNTELSREMVVPSGVIQRNESNLDNVKEMLGNNKTLGKDEISFGTESKQHSCERKSNQRRTNVSEYKNQIYNTSLISRITAEALKSSLIKPCYVEIKRCISRNEVNLSEGHQYEKLSKEIMTNFHNSCLADKNIIGEDHLTTGNDSDRKSNETQLSEELTSNEKVTVSDSQGIVNAETIKACWSQLSDLTASEIPAQNVDCVISPEDSRQVDNEDVVSPTSYTQNKHNNAPDCMDSKPETVSQINEGYLSTVNNTDSLVEGNCDTSGIIVTSPVSSRRVRSMSGLRSVLLAESPRVADTLDTLPGNNKPIYKYAPVWNIPPCGGITSMSMSDTKDLQYNVCSTPSDDKISPDTNDNSTLLKLEVSQISHKKELDGTFQEKNLSHEECTVTNYYNNSDICDIKDDDRLHIKNDTVDTDSKSSDFFSPTIITDPCKSEVIEKKTSTINNPVCIKRVLRPRRREKISTADTKFTTTTCKTDMLNESSKKIKGSKDNLEELIVKQNKPTLQTSVVDPVYVDSCRLSKVEEEKDTTENIMEKSIEMMTTVLNTATINVCVMESNEVETTLCRTADKREVHEIVNIKSESNVKENISTLQSKSIISSSSEFCETQVNIIKSGEKAKQIDNSVTSKFQESKNIRTLRTRIPKDSRIDVSGSHLKSHVSSDKNVNNIESFIPNTRRKKDEIAASCSTLPDRRHTRSNTKPKKTDKIINKELEPGKNVCQNDIQNGNTDVSLALPEIREIKKYDGRAISTIVDKVNISKMSRSKSTRKSDNQKNTNALSALPDKRSATVQNCGNSLLVKPIPEMGSVENIDFDAVKKNSASTMDPEYSAKKIKVMHHRKGVIQKLQTVSILQVNSRKNNSLGTISRNMFKHNTQLIGVHARKRKNNAFLSGKSQNWQRKKQQICSTVSLKEDKNPVVTQLVDCSSLSNIDQNLETLEEFKNGANPPETIDITSLKKELQLKKPYVERIKRKSLRILAMTNAINEPTSSLCNIQEKLKKERALKIVHRSSQKHHKTHKWLNSNSSEVKLVNSNTQTSFEGNNRNMTSADCVEGLIHNREVASSLNENGKLYMDNALGMNPNELVPIPSVHFKITNKRPDKRSTITKNQHVVMLKDVKVIVQRLSKTTTQKYMSCFAYALRKSVTCDEKGQQGDFGGAKSESTPNANSLKTHKEFIPSLDGTYESSGSDDNDDIPNQMLTRNQQKSVTQGQLVRKSSSSSDDRSFSLTQKSDEEGDRSSCSTPRKQKNTTQSPNRTPKKSSYKPLDVRIKKSPVTKKRMLKARDHEVSVVVRNGSNTSEVKNNRSGLDAACITLNQRKLSTDEFKQLQPVVCIKRLDPSLIASKRKLDMLGVPCVTKRSRQLLKDCIISDTSNFQQSEEISADMPTNMNTGHSVFKELSGSSKMYSKHSRIETTSNSETAMDLYTNLEVSIKNVSIAQLTRVNDDPKNTSRDSEYITESVCTGVSVPGSCRVSYYDEAAYQKPSCSTRNVQEETLQKATSKDNKSNVNLISDDMVQSAVSESRKDFDHKENSPYITECEQILEDVINVTPDQELNKSQHSRKKSVRKKLYCEKSLTNAIEDTLMSLNKEIKIDDKCVSSKISQCAVERRKSIDIFRESPSAHLKEKTISLSGKTNSQNSKTCEEEEDLLSDDSDGIKSFYSTTVNPLDNTFNSTFSDKCSLSQQVNQDELPTASEMITNEHGSEALTGTPLSILTLNVKPPTREEILQSLSNYDIPEHRYVEPYFSNAADVVEKKEVGNIKLKVSSRSVGELEMFKGTLPDVTGVASWRRERLQDLWEETNMSSNILQVTDMKSALASERETVITPCKLPPTVKEVKLWVRAKHTMQHPVPSEPVLQNHTPISVTSNSPKSSPVDSGPSHSTPHHLKSGRQRRRLSSPSFTPIPKTQNRRRRLWKQNIATNTVLPSIQENEPGTSGMNDIDPCTSHATKCSLSDHSGSLQPSPAKSEGSMEDFSLHRILLQTQFRQQLISPKGKKLQRHSSCQIEGITPNNTFNFKMSYENLNDVRAVSEHQYLTLLMIELHVQTRGDLLPDPSYDPVQGLFYVVENDVPEDWTLPRHQSGMIVVQDIMSSKSNPLRGTGICCETVCVENELALVKEVVSLVRKWDPDILAGYEVEMLSWGYLFQRAFILEMNLCSLVSRVPYSKIDNYVTAKDKEDPSNEFNYEISLVGRVVLNVWRLLRHEVALQSYTFESIMYHVLHQRVPLHSFRQLTQWWNHRTQLYRWRTVDHYMLRVQCTVKILHQLDLIARTSELARLFGIQFYEVLSRGSQFRVESMMLRLAKPLNFVAVSPSTHQRAHMRAPECLQLIMEPKSRYYTDPLIVLDFQSLYPSMIIAYNYCFSTCLGRVEHLGQPGAFEFGCTHLRVPPGKLNKLLDDINVSPCGVAFVKDSVRKGVLPRMLEEILDTRLMVKKSMKEHKDNKTLQRVLHSRQLGLKLIANVTYGYTAANFSGRMPCIEVGDSVVSKGRETLERAIHMVENTPQWSARVVYGDTDSLFVLVPGRSREQAFKIGAEIAEAVTQDNPKPVKLKLEKVYQPALLQTKKRYVGYMYESAEQEKPVYDAKGIETVRRDGCPAVAKILEKSLRLLFENNDVSLVKKYVLRQFSKLLQGRCNLQDLVFAREYRGMAGYRPGACVPALELTKKWLQTDKRAEPRVGERVPYVVINGPPSLPLIRLVRSPYELLADPSLRINAQYYITRAIIPPLNRCFSLLGAEVDTWFAELPRKSTSYLPTSVTMGHKKSTISQYFSTMNCAACTQLTHTGICTECQQHPQRTAVILAEKLCQWEATHTSITKVCQSCCGYNDSISCISLDCPVLFRKHQASRDLNQADFIHQMQEQYLSF